MIVQSMFYQIHFFSKFQEYDIIMCVATLFDYLLEVDNVVKRKVVLCPVCQSLRDDSG